MKLPNPQNADVPIEKLRDYCLNPNHPKGKHKARVFKSRLGLTTDDAKYLRGLLLRRVVEADNAVYKGCTTYGEQYEIDFKERGVNIRSCWIVKYEEDCPRLTSCYVKDKKE